MSTQQKKPSIGDITKRERLLYCVLLLIDRGGGTRTHDLLHPMQARYQSAPHPELVFSIPDVPIPCKMRLCVNYSASLHVLHVLQDSP